MISTFLRDAWLNATFRNTTYTSPSTVYIALLKGASTNEWSPTDKSQEVTDANNYARIAVAFDAPSGAHADPRIISNTAEVTSNVASGSWGTITHVAIVDSATRSAEHLLYHGELSEQRIIGNGDQIRFAAGALDISLAGT